MRILVTGGAGYVGSIVAEQMGKAGHQVIVLDNLDEGHKSAVPPGAELVVVDLTDRESLARAFPSSVDAVMHLAAESTVRYSMTDPGRYFRTNIIGGLNLLDVMREHDVSRLIFSSTAAVYGEYQDHPFGEFDPGLPLNAYGESKLQFERILEWYRRAYGLQFISFRYFNAAGATKLCGEDHLEETHLIPNVLRAALEELVVEVFGGDYPTRDGTCVRDYIHVTDIAMAHIQALERLDKLSGRCYNLGSGKGYSVLDVIKVARRVTGKDIRVSICLRRAGDPAMLVASADKAREELSWQPHFDLESIIESAWRWMRAHPQGYPS